jgi:UMF1 family MFS transporter
MVSERAQNRLSLIGWLGYDFANTIFSMNILTMYFAQWIIVDLECPDIYYSIAYSGSMALVALTLPVLGDRSDYLGNKKGLLVGFTVGCILTTTVMGIASLAVDDPVMAAVMGLVCVAAANYFFEGGLVFYNALLPSVSTPANAGAISGLGVGIGYVGSIAGLLLVQPIVNHGFAFLPAGRPSAFFPTAILFLVFFIPTVAFLREKHSVTPATGVYRRSTLRQSLKEAASHRAAFTFLVADFMFEDAIATLIIFMAVYAQKVMGLPDDVKVTLFIVSTVSAVGGSIVSGRLSDRIGHYRALRIVVFSWVVLLITASFTTSVTVFWVIGSVFGILLGSTWSISRPLLNTLAPESKLGLFYGLYSLSGRTAAIIGPLVWGSITMWWTESSHMGRAALWFLDALGLSISVTTSATIQYRLAVIALAGLMFLGLVVYLRIPRIVHIADDPQHT